MLNITCIVTHHLNQNDPYLLAALEGINWQLPGNYKMTTYVVSSAEKAPDIKTTDSVKLIHDPKLNNATKKFEFIYNLTKDVTDQFLMHSDDVVMAGDCVKQMVFGAEIYSKPMIQNVMCNGDIPFNYITVMPLGDSFIPTTTDLDWYRGKEEYLKQPVGGYPMLINFTFVTFFCTMVSSKVFEIIGMLDERLDLKNNDLDFCKRAQENGINTVINFGSRCLHFGSKTLNIVKTKEDDEKADKIFREKHFGENK